jgi:glycosyltransferase involved in cell wall biosynthesis
MRITLAIPVLNESVILEKAVTQLHRFFVAKKNSHDWHIVIADNGSTDGTAKTAQHLARELVNVHYIRTPQRGKGLAIRTAWLAYPADAYAFMDADLATELEVFINIAQNSTDITIGSRFHPHSKTHRSLMRWFYAHGYRKIAQYLTKTTINDLPCGAKMCNAKVVHDILPHTQNNHWFFDSELVIKAEKQGFRIIELPIKWNPHRIFPGRISKAFPWKVIKEYLHGLMQIKNTSKIISVPPSSQVDQE